MSKDARTFLPFSDANSGQTIFVNPATVRFVMAAGHRTLLVFSETHTVTVTADLESVIADGLFSTH